MTVPAWLHDAVFYQIFPDRFYNGSGENDPYNIEKWDAKPTFTSYFGGDLVGIREKLAYLEDLGVNALYLNPIFLSTTPHGYNTSDYFQIDPRFGTLQDFKDLIEAAHQKGMRVILDGVFNHTGRGFFAFVDILENGERSPYIDWYHVNHFPLHAYDSGKAESYKAWFDIKSLPKLNTDNPHVCDHIMNVIRYWLNLGIDGWRLDVPNEIDSDHFWSRFREAVKEINPDAYIVGEIWHPEPRWVKFFDGLMNYPFRDAMLALLNDANGMQQFVDTIEMITTIYPWENVLSMYVLLGSHDTARIATKLDNDIRKIHLATMMQFFFPGIPAIYYGDEIGMQGGKDPECRAGFIWDEKEWNHEIRDWVKALISLRKESSALQKGMFKIVHYDVHEKTCLFERKHAQETLLMAANFSPTERVLTIDADTIKASYLVESLSGKIIQKENGAFTIQCAPFAGFIFEAK